jgi:hypothetical protein
VDLTRYQLAAAYDAVPAKAPSEGERTGVQSGVYGYAPFGGVGGWGPNLPAAPAGAFPWPRYPARGGVAGGFPFNPFGQTQGGYDSAPPPTYDLYRTMDGHPTLALARGVVMSPILAASWSYESKKGTPDDRVDFVRETFDGLRAFVLSQMSRGLSFGHRGFELVYEQRAFSNRTLLTVRKFKPLRPEKTTIVADQQTGAFQGFKQPGPAGQPEVVLPVEKAFLYTYDQEDDDYRGRSRHENVREHAWWPWVRTALSGDKLDQKISGIIPIVKFPPGKGQDESGADVDNFKLALGIIAGLAAGRGVVLENLAGVIDDPRLAAEFAKMSLWDVDFHDAGHTATAMGGFIDKLRYLDSCMMRGWLLPERTALEGQFGTKAEAGIHGDVGLTGSDLLHKDMVRCLNWHVVDRLLALNYGEDARGTVWIEPGPLVDEDMAFFRELFQQILTNPAFAAAIIKAMDVDSIIDRIDVPKRDDAIIDLKDVQPLPTPPQPGRPVPPQNGNAQPGSNGDGQTARRLNMSRGLALLGSVAGEDDDGN